MLEREICCVRSVYKSVYHTIQWDINMYKQCVKKVVSDSPGLVDFAIGLVNSVLKMKFFGEFKLRKNCKSILLIK